MPPLHLTDWAVIQETQAQRRPQSLLAPHSLHRGCCPPLSQTLGTTKDPATASAMSFSCRLITGSGFMGQHQRGTCSLPAALSFLQAGCIAKSAQHRSLPSSSEAMLFLLPSWTGQGGYPLPRIGLCLGMDTPGHPWPLHLPPTSSYSASNTNTSQHAQRVKRTYKPCLAAPSFSWGQGQDRWTRALNKAGSSWQG